MTSIDLLIQDDDLVLSGIGEPVLISAAQCIAQDLRHMIREKGYGVQLVGQRSRVKVLAIAKAVEIEMENDERIYPGTAQVRLIGEELICMAKTVDGEAIEATL